MNDSIFEDKSLSSAVTNKYKEMLFRNLNDPDRAEFKILRENVSAKYSDYKTVRLGFNKDTPELRKALQGLYRKTADDFSRYMRDLRVTENGTTRPFLDRVAASEGIASDPAHWQLAGLGSTPDEAGISARVAREPFRDGLKGGKHAEDFDIAAARLSRQLQEAEGLRSELQRTLPAASGIMIPSGRFGKSKQVLSADALEILRKARVYDPDPRAYLKHVHARFRHRFGVSLSANQITNIRDYFNLGETFSPGLYHVTRSGIPIESASFGIVSVDFAGLGAKTARGTLEGIIPGSRESGEEGVRQAMHRAKDLVGDVSAEFERNKANFRAAVESVGPDHGVHFSGDDGAFIPSHELRADDKQKLLTAAGKSIGGDARVVFLPSRYRGSGQAIGAGERHRLIAEGESVEKAVKALLNTPKNAPELKEVLIGVDYLPNSAEGDGVMHLLVSGRGSHDPELSDQLRAAFEKVMAERAREGMRPGRVTFLP